MYTVSSRVGWRSNASYLLASWTWVILQSCLGGYIVMKIMSQTYLVIWKVSCVAVKGQEVVLWCSVRSRIGGMTSEFVIVVLLRVRKVKAPPGARRRRPGYVTSLRDFSQSRSIYQLNRSILTSRSKFTLLLSLYSRILTFTPLVI